MYRYSSANNKTLLKAASSLLMENPSVHSREAAFDPLNYEFDAETMIEPFTYFHNGPTESRQKINNFSSPSLNQLLWLPTYNSSIVSSPDESPQSCFSPVMNEYLRSVVSWKHQQTSPQRQQNQQQQQRSQQSIHPKAICKHCKSHNMPECLYTSHTMYDETGALFCPVLKKCHCATCIRVTNPDKIRDDDSDDESHLRLPTIANEFNHLYGIYPRELSYRMINNNNF